MSIVAHPHSFVVGVDTHARQHVYTILTAHTGAVLDTQDFPTTALASTGPSPGLLGAPNRMPTHYG